MKFPSGVALGPVDHALDAGALERRHPCQGLDHVLLEVLPIVLEQLKGEVGRRRIDQPRSRIGLIAAHDEPADLLLEIGAAIGVAHRGNVAAGPRSAR